MSKEAILKLVELDEQRKLYKRAAGEEDIDVDNFSDIRNLKKEINNSQLLTVNFGDLINRISLISGVKSGDLKLQISTNVAVLGDKELTLDDMIKYFDNPNHQKFIRFDIDGISNMRDFKRPFKYTFSQPIDLEQELADGRKLKDNLSVEYDEETKHSVVVIDKPELLMVNLPIEYLENGYSENNFPMSMMKRAVVSELQSSMDSSDLTKEICSYINKTINQDNEQAEKTLSAIQTDNEYLLYGDNKEDFNM